MQTSESVKEIYGALVAIGDIQNPPKNATNPHFKNRYADLSGILDAVKPNLKKNGLAVVQGVEAEGNQVKIQTRIIHISGEWIESELTLQAAGTDPQKIGSAITYGRRYSISAILNIAADDDDDGEENRPKNPPQSTQKQNPVNQSQQAKKAAQTALSPVDLRLKSFFDVVGMTKAENSKLIDYARQKIGIQAAYQNMSDDAKAKIAEYLENIDPNEMIDAVK